MNNREVAHLWANQSRKQAKGSHFFFEGATIYSYGYHFPIARIIAHPTTGAPCVLYTTKGYSMTTAKHKSYVRAACTHLDVYCVTDPMAQVRSEADLERLVADDTARRVQAEKDKREARNALARRQREAARRVAAASAAYDGELCAWRVGGQLPQLCNMWGTNIPRVSVALRLIENSRYIETTKGAKVPACVARRAWPMLKAAVDAEEANPSPFAWRPFFSLPEFNWGDYRGIALRRVALGSPVELVIGCHQIPWAEVELIAESMGLHQVNREVAS